MINISELKKYYPNLNGFEKNILREYLQYKILDIIFRSKIANKLSFLGGTAIKICYGSSRFSEDLDFDNFNLSADEFEKMSLVIKKELDYEGYESEVRNVFKGAFRCYIKIPKLLHDNKLSNYTDEKIVIQVDTAPHGFKYAPANFLLQKFDVFKSIKATPADIILSQKAGAIFGRKRAKGRDFYDMVYLMGMADFNFDYLDFKLGIKNKAQLKKKLLEKASGLNFNELAKDVLPFLIKPDDKERVLSFKEYIEQRL
ncbi:nucleotidyl transferase AbiEii/AbiGii toxin family protein [Patescibacteria group bacterium]|nr:nucleotidyl transferase AbiEii/AbiGii toxin family protein [Candidatus Falkowbacteria bacterium]MBU3906006.1 nucleotidyl transferase AbiEii/AbiGii toxin family protein [Patescibacteria group bacterium]MBU4026295.1 nucleotidyl transferase AbiEii/AbiGii toxin family protein [Patescibacteria group bacterium]MBU4073182.1 nucleotidyl transferase AbiEii/AbiGii toxin family protein [Patescibacteria group bacterium]MBU4102694.1 nucleotidyl transferase AbiEii/AbiGii toxin family protein [Patescibacte